MAKKEVPREPDGLDEKVVYCIRLPRSVVGEVRSLAEAAGLKPSVMLRDWIVERVAKEAVKK